MQSLHGQIQSVIDGFPAQSPFLGLILIGSCSRGEATYRSDIDCLCVLDQGPLNYSRVCALRDELERRYAEATLREPLQCEFHFVLPSAFETDEPAMRKALRLGAVLVDPTGQLTQAQQKLRREAV